MTFHATGTASVTSGTTTITFAGAMLGSKDEPAIKPGDLYLDPAQPLIPGQRLADIDYVAGTAELWVGWPGTTMAAAPYEVRFVEDGARSTAQTRRYLERLGQLANLGIQPNAFGDFADRAAFDGQTKGYIFLSLDGDGVTGVWTVYIKQTATPGDWDAGQQLQGAVGQTGPSGVIGNWRGAWVTTTVYAVKDAAERSGSSYICKVAHVAGDFATDLAAGRWELSASKGATGNDGVLSANEEIVTAASRTISAADNGKIFIADRAGGVTFNFDPVASLGTKWLGMFKNVGAGPLTIDPDAAETIDGVASLMLSTSESAMISGNGALLRSHFRGSAVGGLLTKTAAYTVVAANAGSLILADASAGAFTLSLTAAATLGDKFEISVKKTDASANAITIDPNGAETIDGAATFVLDERYEEVRFRSDGANWHVVAYFAPRALNARERLTADRTLFVGYDMGAVAISIATPGVVTKVAHGLVANSRVSFAIPPHTKASTITIATPGVVTRVAHGWAAGQPFKFGTTGALPTGAVAGTTYYVIAAGLTADSFRFAATVGGAAINTTGTQSGSHFTEASGTLPTGVVAGQNYFVLAAGLTADTFRFSATSGGAAINTTGSTEGTINARTGSDSNDGLTNTPGGALLTIQKAVNLAAALDANGFAITVPIADGVYGDATGLANVVGVAAAGKCIIRGNTTTPANVVISTTSADCFSANGLYTPWDILDLKMQTTTGGDCLHSEGGSLIRFGNVNFGACAGTHISSIQRGSIQGLSSYTTSGGATVHVSSSYFSYANINGLTLTIVGTPAFGFAFATAQLNSLLAAAGNTFNGAATGARHYVSQAATIFTNGSTINAYFPGSSNGTGTNFGSAPYGLYA